MARGSFFLGLLLVAGSTEGWAASCESLKSLNLPVTTVTMAVTVPAGAFAPPNPWNQGGAALASVPARDLPAFCRVALTIRPSSDSDIKVEVWLPASGWNHKFMAVGNGGWAGTISYGAMSGALASGYASASTDTGHEGTNRDGSFAFGHPEKLVDFGYRAVHEMAVNGKAVVAAFYGETPKFSYWNGCSTGGRQGLMEAQRFPNDFDGIVAGAPANYMTHLLTHVVAIAQFAHKDDASYIPPAKYPMIHTAVLAACDAADGVKDGVIDDPRRCNFDPQVLQCKNADAGPCLTAAQVETARRIYSPIANSRTKEVIYPRLEPGSELGWGSNAGPRPNGIGESYWKYVVFNDPHWDYKTLKLDSGVALADKADSGSTLNAINPDLRKFIARGGKLLQYHGWSDNQIAPQNSVNYFMSVQRKMGADNVRDSFRLFMIPGMRHCGGGDGINSFNSIRVIEQWVENGEAPDMILGSRIVDGKTVRTRPLCPYPQVAKYNGAGSTDDAANFSCKAP